ncbi:potassium channel family protein [Roseivirga sp. BDSF3-8]|uniref:potassium channel family protein n=1 Tax=Roseivirga sp. BDSF3-8 TaxID=3241598 RepID=UPI00353196B6
MPQEPLSILIHISGVALVLLTLIDFCFTAFIPNKEGLLTRKVSRGVYGIMFLLAGKKGTSPVLNYMGFAIMFCMSLTWIFSSWAGFTLIFLSDPYSVIHGTEKYPAEFWDVVYFVGFSLSTSGLGDFVASTKFWRIVTALASVVGIMLITMSITYLVPVISNMIQKRKVSIYLASLGESPEQIVVQSYNGEDFKSLGNHLGSLAAMVFEYSRNHLSYPILHYMHNNSPHDNIVLKMCSLDEALNIFLFHIPEDKRPEMTDLRVIRRALTQYLSTLKYTAPADDTPPLPDLDVVAEGTGIALRNREDSDINTIYKGLKKRRGLWLANIRENGYSWEDIRGTKFENNLDQPEGMAFSYDHKVFH